VTVSEIVRLPKGTLVKCPNPKCRDTIGRLARDLRLGDKRIYFEGGGQGVRVDRMPICKCCGFHWVASAHDLMRIHTGRGWFPKESTMVEALQRSA